MGALPEFRELAADKTNVLDNPLFTILDQPGIGRYPVAASPLQFGAVPRQPPRTAPLLGQHTDEILSGILGLPDHEIAKLHDEQSRWQDLHVRLSSRA